MLIDLPLWSSVPVHSTAPIELSLGDTVLYRGLGVAVRIEDRARGRRVGIKVIDSPLDPYRLRQLAREAQLRRSVAAGVSVYDAVPDTYRTAVAEAFVAIAHWRSLLDRRERELVSEYERDSQEPISALEAEAEAHVRMDWERVRWGAIEASEDPALEDVDTRRAAKRLTELVLTPILSNGLIWGHAYQKPRGYPGDFELMNLMYEDRRRGESVFSRIIHQLGVEERLASTVRSRRRLLSREVLDSGRKRCGQGSAEFRVTNLGAGPARELSDVVGQWDSPGRLVLTLVDQDAGALEYADRALRIAGARLGGRVDIRCRHVAFSDLLRDSRLLAEIAEQDLVYSAGFFDYLPDAVATALLSGLISLVRPSGRVLVGNAVDAREVKWVPEYVLDWHMIYRSQVQMLALVSSDLGSVDKRVVLDDSGAWQFLEVSHRFAHE